jgi:hypothetical protein
MEDETPVQDAAMQESMGAIADRTKEHLSASDAAIIRLRQRLLRAAEAFSEGILPPGVIDTWLYHSHGEQVLLLENNGWQAAYQRLMAIQYAQ